MTISNGVVRPKCAYCSKRVKQSASAIRKAQRHGKPIFCNRKCFGLSRRKGKSLAQRKAEKAAYDREYRLRDPDGLKARKADYYQRTRDPEKERARRAANMHKHVAYCRRPEYVAKKRVRDQCARAAEYEDFADAWRLLLELEREIRSRMSKYERLKARGYFERSAQQRRRELWRAKQNSLRAI